MKGLAVCSVALLALALTACSSGPIAPSATRNIGVPAQNRLARSRAVVVNALILQHRRKHHRHARATFVIRIPRKHRHRKHLGPHFVTPSTESIAIAIDGGTPVDTNLTPRSSACTNYSTQSYTQCQIVVTTTVGSHTFSLTTYDGPNATGNKLSANTDVPVTVNAGANPPVSIVLGGIAASLEFLLPGSVSASPTENDVYGDITFSVSVFPLDADRNMILGAGAPTVSMTPPPGAKMTLTQDTANTWTIASTYQSANPVTPNSWTIAPQATPVPNSGGSTVSLPVPFNLYQPWIYVTNESGSSSNWVGITDENGNVKTPVVSSGTPFSHVPSPTGIAYDPSNQWPYILDYSGSTVCVYTVMGALIGVSGAWTGLGSPQAIAYVPATSANGLTGNRLYVGSLSPSGSDYIAAYDEKGNKQTLTGGSVTPFGNVYQPRGIAYDSNSGHLYITDNEYPSLFEFDTQGNQIAEYCYQPNPTCLSPGSLFGGITFDSGNALLYATVGPGYSSAGASSVIAISESGIVQSLTGTFPGLNSASGIAYDPYNGSIYVVDHSAGKVFQYDEQGNELRSFSSQGRGPVGIAVVP
jgi:hypothetical protein